VVKEKLGRVDKLWLMKDFEICLLTLSYWGVFLVYLRVGVYIPQS